MESLPLLLGCIGRTPMVRLNRVAAGLPATVLGKCEFLNPGGSIKDRIALAIVEEAELHGRLRPAPRSSRRRPATPGWASPWSPPPKATDWSVCCRKRCRWTSASRLKPSGLRSS